MSAYCPKRGDIVWISFTPQAGHRPAAVLSPEPYNRKVGLALLCPITTKVKGDPFEVVIPEGLKAKGVILSDQIKSLDWNAHQASLLCRLPEATIKETLNKVGTLLDT